MTTMLTSNKMVGTDGIEPIDTRIFSPLLYLLSYVPKNGRRRKNRTFIPALSAQFPNRWKIRLSLKMVGKAGFAPTYSTIRLFVRGLIYSQLALLTLIGMPDGT